MIRHGAAPGSSDDSLEDLMERLASGDRLAFSPVFERLWNPAFRYARHLLGDETGAEDVVQRALIRLFESASNYRKGASVLAWALNLTFWEVRTERKRKSRRRESSWSGHEPEAADRSEDELLDREAREQLGELIAELSDEERAVLGLDDPSLLTHLTPSTVRKRRQRLIARLRLALIDLGVLHDEP